MLKTVKDLKKALEGVDENLEIVTEPNDHTYWKGIVTGEMLVEVDKRGEYCDTLAERVRDKVRRIFFIGVY